MIGNSQGFFSLWRNAAQLDMATSLTMNFKAKSFENSDRLFTRESFKL
jgi:hypothetical protein